MENNTSISGSKLLTVREVVYIVAFCVGLAINHASLKYNMEIFQREFTESIRVTQIYLEQQQKVNERQDIQIESTILGLRKLELETAKK